MPSDVHLLELDADELHEDAGGRRVAQAITGAGLSIESAQSRYDVLADRKGLLRVDAELLLSRQPCAGRHGLYHA